MTAARAPSGTAIDLAYMPACGALGHTAYWGTGPIVGAPSWTGAACALGTTGLASFDPGDPEPGGWVYFALVGQNATAEGSYGTAFDGLSGIERPEAVGAGACDLPQVLGGTCP